MQPGMPFEPPSLALLGGKDESKRRWQVADTALSLKVLPECTGTAAFKCVDFMFSRRLSLLLTKRAVAFHS